jgi:hypothetical protein
LRTLAKLSRAVCEWSKGGYRFIKQSGAKENNTFSRSPQRPGRRAKQGQPVDALRPERNEVEPKGAKADKRGCREEEGGTAKDMTSWERSGHPQGVKLLFLP